jgi:hypothetical protein
MSEDHRCHERVQLKLDIAEVDERRMAGWRRLNPEDVVTENAFWATKKAERRARRAAKKAEGRARR